MQSEAVQRVQVRKGFTFEGMLITGVSDEAGLGRLATLRLGGRLPAQAAPFPCPIASFRVPSRIIDMDNPLRKPA